MLTRPVRESRPTASTPGSSWRRCACALEGGVALLQYRQQERRSPDEAPRQEASELAQLAARARRAAHRQRRRRLALEVDADGVHLGRDDGGSRDGAQRLAAGSSASPATTTWSARAAARRRGRRLRRVRQLLRFAHQAGARCARRSRSVAHDARRAALSRSAASPLGQRAARLIDAGADAARRDLRSLRRARHRARGARHTASSSHERTERSSSSARSARIPGGVNSPVRAFRSVGGTPRFFERGDGRPSVGRRRQALHRLRRLVGTDDRRPRASGRGRGACRRPRRRRSRSARRPKPRSSWRRCCAGWLPSLELVRLVSSGTEATMTALRLARGFTGRSQIIKFEGCYHGHGDSLLVKAGSGALTFGNRRSAGVPPEIADAHARARRTTTLPQVEAAFAANGARHRLRHRRAGRRQHEPRPARGRLPRGAARRMRRATARVLIFDEVMTGFRVALRAARRACTASRPTSRRSAR